MSLNGWAYPMCVFTKQIWTQLIQVYFNQTFLVHQKTMLQKTPETGSCCWCFGNTANQLRLVVYPITYSASYIQTVVIWDFCTINTIWTIHHKSLTWMFQPFWVGFPYYSLLVPFWGFSRFWREFGRYRHTLPGGFGWQVIIAIVTWKAEVWPTKGTKKQRHDENAIMNKIPKYSRPGKSLCPFWDG